MRSTRSVPIAMSGEGVMRRILRRNLTAISGLALLALSAAIAASLATWTVDDPSLSHATDRNPRNALGLPGAVVADLIMQFFGLAAIALLLPPVVWAWRLVFGRTARFGWRTFAAWVGSTLIAALSLATLPVIGTWPLPTGFWFGFNAGSNLEANYYAVLAMANTFVATAAAAVTWVIIESFTRGKASLLGAVSGAVVGLVAVTPAAGYAGPMGSIVLGIVATIISYFFVAVVKNALKYDDSLDVFGIHCIGGIVGALATGILVNPALGGAGIVDYLSADLAVGYPGTGTQVWNQLKGVVVTLLWSGIGSAILYKIVDLIIGLRVSPEVEREGLDLASHGEVAYHQT